MLRFVRKTIKETVLETQNPLLRFAVDEVVRRRASGRINLNPQARIHAALQEPLSIELSKVLGFGSEFESELYVRRFEADFARRCGGRFAVGTHSGTAALQFALTALGIGEGDEVITVPNTYVATALAISNVGAKPVFVDVDPHSFNLDPARIEAALTSRTKAILPVHLFGQMARMDQIARIAAKHGLKVVEDACQAFGALSGGQGPGSLSQAACYSFSTAKTLGGLGNGGMVVTNDTTLAAKLRVLRNPESNHPLLRQSRRTPCYLDAVQVAVLRAKLPFIDEWIRRRQAHAARYRQALSGTDLLLPTESDGCRHVYYRFAVQFERRKELLRHLARAGIRASPTYSPSLHLSPVYSDLGYAAGSLPHAEHAEKRTLFLPVSSFLSDEEHARVCTAVKDFLTSAASTHD